MKSQLLSITLLFVIGQVIGGSIGGQFEKEQNPRPTKPNWGVSTIAQLENEGVPEDSDAAVADDANDCSGGYKSKIRNCCTEDSPCDVGQGHCKANRGCKGELVCGRKNCDISKFPQKRTRCCEVANSTTNSTTPVEKIKDNLSDAFAMLGEKVKKVLSDDDSEDAVDAATPPDVRASGPPAPSTPASLNRLHAQNEKKKGGKTIPLAK